MHSERTIYDYSQIDSRLRFKLGKVNNLSAQSPLGYHVHEDSIEIVYFISGDQHFTIGDKDYLVKGGDILISKPSESHSSGNDNMNRARFYYLIVDKQFFYDESMSVNGEGSQFYNRFNQIDQYLYRGNHQTLALFDQLFNGYSVDSVLKQSITVGSLWCLLDNLMCCTELMSNSQDKIFEEIIQYIECNIEEVLTVEQLAVLSPWSLSRFKIKFREYAGYTPKAYVMERKIERAKSLLEETALSITQIAHQLSFSSSQHFSAVFKRYTRMTPTEYQKANSL